MKYFNTCVQLLTILAMCGVIVQCIRDGIKFRRYAKSETKRAVLSIEITDLSNDRPYRNAFWRSVLGVLDGDAYMKIDIAEGDYYMGNSILKRLCFSNYIYLQDVFLQGNVEFLVKVEKKKLQISVLKGKLTTLRTEYPADESRWISFSKREFFMIGNRKYDIL